MWNPFSFGFAPTILTKLVSKTFTFQKDLLRASIQNVRTLQMHPEPTWTKLFKHHASDRAASGRLPSSALMLVEQHQQHQQFPRPLAAYPFGFIFSLRGRRQHNLHVVHLIFINPASPHAFSVNMEKGMLQITTQFHFTLSPSSPDAAFEKAGRRVRRVFPRKRRRRETKVPSCGRVIPADLMYNALWRFHSVRCNVGHVPPGGLQTNRQTNKQKKKTSQCACGKIGGKKTVKVDLVPTQRERGVTSCNIQLHQGLPATFVTTETLTKYNK